jgi:hypothetical protein
MEFFIVRWQHVYSWKINEIVETVKTCRPSNSPLCMYIVVDILSPRGYSVVFLEHRIWTYNSELIFYHMAKW